MSQVIQYHRVGVIPVPNGPGWPINSIQLPPSHAMGDIVNLRIARKRAKRRRDEREAAAARLTHGRSKSERTLTRANSDKAKRSLDHHRIETGDGP